MMSESLYVFLLVGLSVGSVAGCTVVLVRVRIYLRRKGYRSPLVTAALAASAFVGLFGGMILFSTRDRLISTNSYTWDPALARESLTHFGTYFAGVLAAVVFATVLIAAMLPAREIRISGERRARFPWRAAGYVSGALVVVYPAATLSLGIELIEAIRPSAMLFLPLALYSFGMARRARAKSLPVVLEADSRSPVLYLRAFNREAELFVELSMGEMETYTSYTANQTGVTFEQYFSAAVNDAIGPLVALGSPEDYLSPEGATRLYASDTDWVQHFRDLAGRSACILMEVTQSENLRLELQTLRTEGWHEKLFIFTRPAARRGWRNWRFALGRAVLAWLAHQKGVVPVSWAGFVQALATLGYRLTPHDPGPGAVIAFDRDATSVLLATGAHTPSEFIAAIQARRLEQETDPVTALPG
jgi:hypothetical protein